LQLKYGYYPQDSKQCATPAEEEDTMLRPDRHPNLDFFVADLWAWPVKDDQASMEHPFFSLSKKPDTLMRQYQHKGNTIIVRPNVLGMPTIWDKDILIFCCSQLLEHMKHGNAPRQVVRFQVHNFLVSTNRTDGAKGYMLLKQALGRLSGVRIQTNVKTGDVEETRDFGIVDWWHMVEDASVATVQLKLSDWFYRAVTNREVLTIHKDYFRLDGGLERRVYELCRKHCGYQEKWSITLELLQGKSGSFSPLWRFRKLVTRLATEDHLPEYHLKFAHNKLTAYPKTHKGGLRELKDTLGL
jgi:plasmid replication initiation protein